MLYYDIMHDIMHIKGLAQRNSFLFCFVLLICFYLQEWFQGYTETMIYTVSRGECPFCFWCVLNSNEIKGVRSRKKCVCFVSYMIVCVYGGEGGRRRRTGKERTQGRPKGVGKRSLCVAQACREFLSLPGRPAW